MYLHLGGDISVKEKEIVGIFDLDTASVGKATKEFLKSAQKKGRIIDISSELPKAFVITADKKNEGAVYLAQVASSTILKRSRLKSGGLTE